MRLRFKILMGFSILILILAGMSVYNLIFLQNTDQVLSEIVDKKFETDKIIQDTNTIILQIHSDIWDAMLFDGGALQTKSLRVKALEDSAKQVYANIREMTARMSEKEESFKSLKQFFQYYIQFGSRILDFGDIAEVKENQDVVDKFKENKSNLIAILDEVTTSSSDEFSTALVDLKETFSFTNLLMIILTVIAVLSGILAALIISSTLTKPIYNLVDTMKEVESDNYDVEAKIITKDEIGKLALTFNNMTKQIKISRDNLKDQERLKKEMEIAERIQTSLCPPAPKHDSLEIAASMQPAEEVGGDYYDLIADKDGNLWIAIGDVSGHGVTPGLVMMMAETAFNQYIVEKGAEKTPKDAIVSVNRILTENIRNRLKEKHFMTMNFLKYLGDGKFIQSGSHVDIIVYRAKTKTCDIYPTDGVYMGIVPDISGHTTDKSFELGIDDIVIVYTDGVIESRNKDDVDNLLGLDAVVKTIVENGDKSANDVMEAVREEAMAWCGYKPDDDITMVVAKRLK